MTCIVGLVHEGVVYIGGDSAGVAGLSLTVRADEKVFQNGEFLMGFTTSFRMGQLLRYSLKPPCSYPDDDINQYMVVGLHQRSPRVPQVWRVGIQEGRDGTGRHVPGRLFGASVHHRQRLSGWPARG